MTRQFSRAESFSVTGVSFLLLCFLRRLQPVWHVTQSFKALSRRECVQDDIVHQAAITRRLNWHIMSRFCLLTVMNHMDRANLVRLHLDTMHQGAASDRCLLGYEKQCEDSV